MKYFKHLITVPHQNSTLQNCPTVCDTRDAWEGPRRLSRLSAPAKAKTARSLEKAQADAIQARDGKRWQEMARGLLIHPHFISFHIVSTKMVPFKFVLQRQGRQGLDCFGDCKLLSLYMIVVSFFKVIYIYTVVIHSLKASIHV